MERRTFLALGAAVVGLTGCTSGPADPDGTPTPTAPDVQRDPDAALRDEVAASEIALLAAYRSALQEHPELAGDLAPFVAHHEAHLARISPGSTAGAGGPAPSTPPRTSGSPSPVPSVAGTVAALASAESRAQAQRAAACNGAVDPGLARDLCLVAASEAQHAALLEALAGEEASS